MARDIHQSYALGFVPAAFAVDAADGYARIAGKPALIFTDAGPAAANLGNAGTNGEYLYACTTAVAKKSRAPPTCSNAICVAMRGG